LVTVRFFPTALNVAAPLTTEGPTGLACTAVAKQDATATCKRRRRKGCTRCVWGFDILLLWVRRLLLQRSKLRSKPGAAAGILHETAGNAQEN
jgi:hypothetical protein